MWPLLEKTPLNPIPIRKYHKSDGGHLKRSVVRTRSVNDTGSEPFKHNKKQGVLKIILVTCPETLNANVNRAWIINYIMDLFKYCDVMYISPSGVYLLLEIPHIVEDMKDRGLFKQQGLFDDIKSLEFIVWREKENNSLIAQRSADSGISFNRVQDYVSSSECATVCFHDLNTDNSIKSVCTNLDIVLHSNGISLPLGVDKYALSPYSSISKDTLSSQKAEFVPTGKRFPASRRVTEEERVSSNGFSNPEAGYIGSIGGIAPGLNPGEDATRQAPHDVHGGQRIYSQSVSKPPRYPRYSEEPRRVESYRNWPHEKPTPNECATTGFFYTGDDDLIRCFQCGIGLKDFNTEDNPMEEHIKHSESCHYLVTLLGVEELTLKRNRLKSSNPENIRRRQYADFRRNRGVASGKQTDRNPEYKTLESRLFTFENANFICTKRPQQLATAGFFYTGQGDHVRCFSCNGGLRNWEEHDDPWTEHCKWFPACGFAKDIKGELFIENIQQRHQPSMTMMNVPVIPSTATHRPNLDQELGAIKITCIEEMGFNAEVFDKAVHQLKQDGYDHPGIDDILNRIDLIQMNTNQTVSASPTTTEAAKEENKRLKSMLICSKCNSRNTNALFFPCAHHVMCLECASDVIRCPVCNRGVSNTVRTYMG